jgi:hypothetical protein
MSEDADRAQRHRDRMAQKSRDEHAAAAEIGELPPVKDPARRERSKHDLHYGLVEYFPGSTGLSPFSDDHKRVIQRIQDVIAHGGQAFNIVYRGFSKTTVIVNAVILASAHGLRCFILIVGATKKAARAMLKAIKKEWQSNQRLAEDFPEIALCVKKIGGAPNRCRSQTHNGELTCIEWGPDHIVLPTIKINGVATPSSGVKIEVFGIDCAARGSGERGDDGTQQRPDFIIGDDLQTDRSAKSPTQVDSRLETLNKGLLGSSGHDTAIACVINGTIIKPDDAIDRLRDQLQFPGWQGEVVPMVKSWSDAHESFWMSEYARVRNSYDPVMNGDRERAIGEATALYAARKDEVDTGCKVSWDECYIKRSEDPRCVELSAIQHAYNLLIDRGEDAFASEYQQNPFKTSENTERLTIKDVVHKLSGLRHREVPHNAFKLTCFIDVQDESFWYVVIAWTADFTGFVIDYGSWPDQGRDGSKKRLKKSLSVAYKRFKTREARWRAGLSDLCDDLFKRDWLDAVGVARRIDLAFVDVADGDSSIELRSWVKTSDWNKILHCSIGAAPRPGAKAIGEQTADKDTLQRGLNWIKRRDKKIRGGSITTIDTNWWKSFVVNRWCTGSPRPANDPSYRPCEPGALYLWGTEAFTHRTFGAHQTSEYVERQKASDGRIQDFWFLKGGGDNEWLDGVVGCCVLASMAGGVTLKDSGLNLATHKGRKRLTAEELRALRAAKGK